MQSSMFKKPLVRGDAQIVQGLAEDARTARQVVAGCDRNTRDLLSLGEEIHAVDGLIALM